MNNRFNNIGFIPAQNWQQMIMQQHQNLMGQMQMNQYLENDCIAKCNLLSYLLGFECNPYQIPTAFFTELEQNISQIIWKHKRH